MRLFKLSLFQTLFQDYNKCDGDGKQKIEIEKNTFLNSTSNNI